nr:MAG TPA: hypothetical protein [Caudoviricetes sp.]
MKYFGFKAGIGYGFYNERFDGAVELSEQEWQFLLDEQSEGKDIVMYGDKVFASEPDLYYLDSSGKYQKRTAEELNELVEINKINITTNDALNFLNDTDWKVVRHRDQIAMGKDTSLSDEEYTQLLEQRQLARDSVVRFEVKEE